MKTNKAGYDLIKDFEGYHRALPDGGAAAYLDPVGIWTIGWGTIRLNGRPVRKSDVISRKLAQELLDDEVSGFEKDVEKLVKVPLNENQFAALVSFCYNVGAGGFAGSTARRLLNGGDYAGCADALLPWNKGTINGELVELPGLTRRRQAERALFLKAVATSEVPTTPPAEDTVESPPTVGRSYVPCPLPIAWKIALKLGTVGQSVYELQCALIGLGYLAQPKAGELVGELFNDHVEHAVKRLQHHYGALADGVVGPVTQQRIERLLTNARKPKSEPTPANPTDSSVATLRCIEGQWHEGVWAGLKVMNLGIGNETFRVASGARGAQYLRRPQDPRSVPGNFEPIPQGRYKIEGEPEFVSGNDNYEGSFGAGLGPVWHELTADFSDNRGSFGIHQDQNIGTSPGSAGCIVFRDLADLKRYVAAWRKHRPQFLKVDWGLE